MLRRFLIAFLCLAWSWANSVNSVNAQPIAKPAKADKLVRVTYPVADLVVPIPGSPVSDSKDALAETLIQVITNTVARESWNRVGGDGTIQYFPLGMAIVVNQRVEVHAEIARLLAELRVHADVQITVGLHAVAVSPSMAKHLFLEMDEHGKPARAVKEAGKDLANRAATMDEKQIIAMLKLAQSDDSTTIAQGPKITMFNGQQAKISTPGSWVIDDSLNVEILPVVDAEKTTVRLTLKLEHHARSGKPDAQITRAARTFVLPSGRTLVWHLGAAPDGRHLFVLATPRVVIVEESERVFKAEAILAPPSKEVGLERLSAQQIDDLLARQMVKDGFFFLDVNDLDKALFFAGKAEELKVAYAAGEKTPADLLQAIALHMMKMPLRNGVAEEQAIPPQKETNAFGRLLMRGVEWIAPPNDGGFLMKNPQRFIPPSEPYPLPKELRLSDEARPTVAPICPEPTPSSRQLSPKEREIEYRLRKPISLHFKNVPLEQAIKNLATISGIQVVADYRALQDARINLEAPLSISVDNISMKLALNLMFDQLRLKYIIQNEVLMITTEDKSSSRLVRRTYSVADLVQSPAMADGLAKKTDNAAESLKELIENTVARNTWESMGGNGGIQYFPFEKNLVVNQTQEIHEEIDLLLTTLRRLYNLSVEIETRIVTTSAGTAKQWHKEMSRHQQFGSRESSASAKQADFVLTHDVPVLRFLESVQGDRAGHVLQAPKLTLLNGQLGGAFTTLSAEGWRCDVHPVVSPDRKSVRLGLNLEHTVTDESKSIERITKAARTFEVRDGRTLMWYLGETADRQHRFVLVTPRIRVNDVAEALTDVLKMQKSIERSMTPPMRETEERLFKGEIAPIPGR